MSSDKIKVLFIGGSGRSGSTLLEIMLGQIDGFFPAGELMFIWERGLNEDQLCGCGKKFSDCEFWGYVLKEAFGNIVKLDSYKIENLGKSIRRRFIFPIKTKRTRIRINKYSEIVSKLYESIYKTSGYKIIVDSSKDSAYGFLLNNISNISRFKNKEHIIGIIKGATQITCRDV